MPAHHHLSHSCGSKVSIIGMSHCYYTQQAMALAPAAEVVLLDTLGSGQQIRQQLVQLTSQRTVPYVFIDGNFIGGYSEFRVHTQESGCSCAAR